MEVLGQLEGRSGRACRKDFSLQGVGGVGKRCMLNPSTAAKKEGQARTSNSTAAMSKGGACALSRDMHSNRACDRQIKAQDTVR